MENLQITRDNKLDLKYMIPKYLTKGILALSDAYGRISKTNQL